MKLNNMTTEDVKKLLKKIIIDELTLGDTLNVTSNCELWRRYDRETQTFAYLNGQMSHCITIKKEFKNKIPDGYVLVEEPK